MTISRESNAAKNKVLYYNPIYLPETFLTFNNHGTLPETRYGGTDGRMDQTTDRLT